MLGFPSVGPLLGTGTDVCNEAPCAGTSHMLTGLGPITAAITLPCLSFFPRSG